MDRGEVDGLLQTVLDATIEHLTSMYSAPAGARRPAPPNLSPLPERGMGADEALRSLIAMSATDATASPGPRFFHFVTGGATPAALAADWWTAALDQNAFAWIGSPLATRLEVESVAWLLDLFRLPPSWGGVLTSGATMANFTALAAARQWWAGEHGVDAAAAGLIGLPPVPVLSSGYIHTSAVKALSMLGLGRDPVERFSRDDVGRLDLEALEARLFELDGAPAIIVANAGDVDTGDFDPIDAMADLADAHNAWLHVDGAFGLFARVAPSTRALARGAERADSVIADGHKWLNVPYDSGFAFVARPQLLADVFASGAPYLPDPNDPEPVPGYLSPEMSRRARSLAIWATLAAYGRAGYSAMVERHVQLAQRMASGLEALDGFELLAPVQLNIVCFRYVPADLADDAIDQANRDLARAITADGRVIAGGTTYGGRAALRPAIVNWSTSEGDVDFFVDVVAELAAGLADG